MKRLGERTQWGVVGAIGVLNGERYYWFVSECTDTLAASVSMLPASTVEVLTPPCQQKQKDQRA